MTDRTELKQVIYDYHCQASRLMRATPDSFKVDLMKFLGYIENTSIINDYVQRCVSNDLPEGYDADAELDEVQNDSHAKFGPFGGSDEEEVAEIYLILCAMRKQGVTGQSMVFYSYSGGSKKFRDWLKGFLDSVAYILVEHIDGFLTKAGIAMGIDETPSQQFHISGSRNTQINAASFGSSVTATQNNGLDIEALEPLLVELVSASEGMSGDEREVILDGVQALREEFSTGSPKKSVVKTALRTFSGINGGVQFGAAVSQVASFLVPLLQ